MRLVSAMRCAYIMVSYVAWFAREAFGYQRSMALSTHDLPLGLVARQELFRP